MFARKVKSWRATSFENMRDVSKVAGIVLVIIGLVWLLQGLDVALAPQSFMTGDMTWVISGAVAMLAGGFLFWRGRSRGG